jgi:two-component system phosphate regulon response regulator OmpR
MNENSHILIVDDDNRIRELIKEYLEENDFIVSTANDAEEASEKIKLIDFEIIVLDIMMPGESGLALTKKLRKNISTPIILLTAKGEVDDRIIGLESGADDYLVKPFSPKELLLRINNILKKTKEETLEEKIKIGENLLNLKKMIVEKNGKTIKLNGTEKKLLEKMIFSKGKTFSREEIGKIINISKERSVDVMITRLRQKLEYDPKNPQYLQTVRGSGYVLWIE